MPSTLRRNKSSLPQGTQGTQGTQGSRSPGSRSSNALLNWLRNGDNPLPHVARLIRKNPFHLVGYFVFNLWVLLVFWSPAFNRLEGVADAHNMLFFLSLLGNALTLIVFFIIGRRINPLGRFMLLPILVHAAMALGCLLLLLYFQGVVTGLAVLIIGAVLTGIGSGSMMVLWGEAFSSISARQVLLYLIIVVSCGAVVCYVLTLIPQAASQIAACLLPVLSLVLFLCAAGRTNARAKVKENVVPPVFLPLQVVAISVFFGICFGLMRGLGMLQGFEHLYLDNVFNVVAYCAAGTIAFISALIYQFDFRRLMYQIALPLMALGFIFISVPDMQPFSMPLHNFGFQLFFIVLWSLWTYLGSRKDVPACWIVACGMMFLQIGQLVGALFGDFFVSSWPDYNSLNTLALVVLFGILIMALFFLGTERFRSGFNLIKPGELLHYSTEYDTRLLVCCTAIGRTNGLSDREVEVLMLLAQYYQRPQISKKLLISDETVKTHIKHIYQKLDIHTREELIDYVHHEQELHTAGVPDEVLFAHRRAGGVGD